MREKMIALKEKIRILRKLANLKQAQVAEILNVSDNAVGFWETGKRVPDLDNLVKLADLFGVSLDVFRNDAVSLEMPHPFGKKLAEQKQTEKTESDMLHYKNVSLKFGSTIPSFEQSAVLDFCNSYLSTLPEKYFVSGTGQNSKYGTGRYFWESKIDMLMFIGITPPLKKTNNDFVFSVALGVDEPLNEEIVSKFTCLQLTEDGSDTWIYAPIKCDTPFAFGGDLSPQQKKAADVALKTVMQVARVALEIPVAEIFPAGINAK